MQDILDYLKNSGERLDSEIAAATGISIANVRQRVTALQARGAVMLCRSIRYQDGKEIEGILGYRGRDEMIHRDDLVLV